MKLRTMLLPALALITVACGDGSSGAAATVNGEDITIADIEQYMSAEAVDEERFRSELQDAIISEIILTNAEEDFEIAPTEAELEESYQGLVTQVEAQGNGDYEAGLETIGFTDARVRLAAREQLVGQALQEELGASVEPATAAEIDAALAEEPDLYTNACVKHILVETAEDAQTVLDRLEAGEEFATVAQEASTDTQSGAAGGDLGCAPLGGYVPEFATGVREATIGEPAGPIESEFGFHVLLVDSIDDEATIRTNIETTLGDEARQQVVLDWFDEAIGSAEVTVDPQYGEWVTDPQPAIVPPAGSTDTSGSTGTTGGPTGESVPSITETSPPATG